MDRLKKLGKLLGGEEPKERPPEVAVERRAGKRVRLPVGVRFTMGDGSSHEGKLREVNLSGLSIEPPGTGQIGDRLSVGFAGYPGVCPSFVLFGKVKGMVTEGESDAPVAMGVEIDRGTTEPEALKSYRSLVRHYLHHRPLLEGVDKGYFEGRCPACGWLGRVGNRNPVCSKCGQKVEPVSGETG